MTRFAALCFLLLMSVGGLLVPQLALGQSGSMSITTPDSTFEGLALGDQVGPTILSVSTVSKKTSWAVSSGALPAGLTLNAQTGTITGSITRGGIYGFTLSATNNLGQSAQRAYRVQVYTVPRPKAANIPWTLSTIYMPKPRMPSHQWGEMRLTNEKNNTKQTQGQRVPLLGFYQGDSTEVLDWQIKFAVDRGITNFFFNDYWVQGVPEPTYAGSINAFLTSQYGSRMTFAVLLNSINTGTNVSGPAFDTRKAMFLQTILPYYYHHYFKRQNYLKIDGQPVIQVLGWGDIFGTNDPVKIRQFMDEADRVYFDLFCADNPGCWTCEPFPRLIHWSTSDLDAGYVPGQAFQFDRAVTAGFSSFAPYYALPLGAISINHCPNICDTCVCPNFNSDGNDQWLPGIEHAQLMDMAIEFDDRAREASQISLNAGKRFCYMSGAAPDFDSRSIYWSRVHRYAQGQRIDQYQRLLTQVRNSALLRPATLPISSNTGKPIVSLGPWNEQYECSSIEPGYSVFQLNNGFPQVDDPFLIADTVARVFGVTGPLAHDSPGDLSAGFSAGKAVWSFGPGSAGVEQWQSLGNAGLTGTADGDMLVRACPSRDTDGRVPVSLATACYTDTAPYTRVELLLKPGPGFEKVNLIDFRWRSSSYSQVNPDAGDFGSAETPCSALPCPRFFSGIARVDATGEWPLDRSGFLTIQFPLVLNGAPHPAWKGELRELELVFLTNTGGPVQFEVRRMSLLP